MVNSSIILKYRFGSEFIRKTFVSFYVIDFSGGATSIEDVFKLFKNSKLQFLEGTLGLRKWQTDETKLRE